MFSSKKPVCLSRTDGFHLSSGRKKKEVSLFLLLIHVDFPLLQFLIDDIGAYRIDDRKDRHA